jgi:hypothetical protein
LRFKTTGFFLENQKFVRTNASVKLRRTEMKIIRKCTFVFVILSGIVLFGGLQSVHAQRSGSLDWRGTVDDTVRLVIRSRNVRVRTITGTPYNDSTYDFNGGSPDRFNNARVRVDKRDGRGRVYVVEQPSRRNNFRTVIQIDDPKGGADRYRIRVYWD